jgi:hypothetical protein
MCIQGDDNYVIQGQLKSQGFRIIYTLRAPITEFMIDKLSRLKDQSNKKERR